MKHIFSYAAVKISFYNHHCKLIDSTYNTTMSLVATVTEPCQTANFFYSLVETRQPVVHKKCLQEGKYSWLASYATAWSIGKLQQLPSQLHLEENSSIVHGFYIKFVLTDFFLYRLYMFHLFRNSQLATASQLAANVLVQHIQVPRQLAIQSVGDCRRCIRMFGSSIFSCISVLFVYIAGTSQLSLVVKFATSQSQEYFLLCPTVLMLAIKLQNSNLYTYVQLAMYIFKKSKQVNPSSNYRSILLLPLVSKIIEKVVHYLPDK